MQLIVFFCLHSGLLIMMAVPVGGLLLWFNLKVMYNFACFRASKERPYPKTPKDNIPYYILCCVISALFWVPMLVMPPILVSHIIPDSEDVSSTAIRSAGVLFGFVAVFTLSLINTASGSGALAAKNGPACQHNHATVWADERAVCAICSQSVDGYWKCETCAKAWGSQLGVHCRSCTRQPMVSLFHGRGPRCVCWERDRSVASDPNRCCPAGELNILNFNLDVVLAYLSVFVEFFQLSAFTFGAPDVPWSTSGGAFAKVKEIFTVFIVQFDGMCICVVVIQLDRVRLMLSRVYCSAAPVRNLVLVPVRCDVCHCRCRDRSRHCGVGH